MTRWQVSRIRRGASSSLETVLLAGLAFPASVFIAFALIRLCRAVYFVMASLVGWPYL